MTTCPSDAKKQEGSMFSICMAFRKAAHSTKLELKIHTKQSQLNYDNVFWHHRHPLITGFPTTCADDGIDKTAWQSTNQVFVLPHAVAAQS